MRLLIVEDEQRMARALATGLGHAGFAVDVVHDGGEALRSGLETRYDAIILDIMLPVLSGYEVIRRLRAAGVLTPILALSAKDGENDEADGLDLGADDYLTKPVSFVVLLAHLRALLRRGGQTGSVPSAGLVRVAGDLTLDPVAHTVTRAGEPLDLTAREFAFLEYLMREPGKVVSKAELLQRVWNDSGADPNAVEVYVGYLRRKLGRRRVETVRGVGYRLSSA